MGGGGGANSIDGISIPNKLSNYKVDLSPLSGLSGHDQSMIDAISEILGHAASNNHPFKPYMRVYLAKKPWAPPIIEHQRDIDPRGMLSEITLPRRSHRFKNMYSIASNSLGPSI